MVVAYTLVLAVWLVHFVVLVGLVVARVVVERLWAFFGSFARMMIPRSEIKKSMKLK